MRLRHTIMLATPVILACGGSEASRQGGSTVDAPAEVEETGDLVSNQAIARCAGFTTQDAAVVLDVPVEQIEDRSRDETETIRICSYALASDPFTSVSFNLSARESVAEAISGMEGEREMIGVAQTSIEDVMDQTNGGRAYQEVEGVGDEAFWSSLNGAMQMRVGNVFVQVTMPDDIEKQKEVARKVAEGLRGQ